jgi:hypothetical protein
MEMLMRWPVCNSSQRDPTCTKTRQPNPHANHLHKKYPQIRGFCAKPGPGPSPTEQEKGDELRKQLFGTAL